MPLDNPQQRTPVHDRTIQCSGFRRADGLWDIDASLLDIKHEDIDVERGTVGAGEPFHVIAVRVTLNDEMTIVAISGCIDRGPFNHCNQARENLQRLVGVQIGNGWTREVRKLIGATAGCNHLTDLLLGPVAATAIQSISPPYRSQEAHFINSCHMLAEDSVQVMKFWPQHYKSDE